MAKTVEFLNPNLTMHVPGFGKVNSENLTYEKYLKLLEISEQHAVFFLVKDEESKPAPTDKKVKSKQNSNEPESNLQA
jgi:hypothetical protein